MSIPRQLFCKCPPCAGCLDSFFSYTMIYDDGSVCQIRPSARSNDCGVFVNEGLMGSRTNFAADQLFHFYLWPCGANGNTKQCCMGPCCSRKLSSELPHGRPCRNGALLLSSAARTLYLSRAGRFLLSGRFSFSGQIQILRGKWECEPSYHANLILTSQDVRSGPLSREDLFRNTHLTLLTFLE